MIFKELETDQDWSEAIALRNIYNWTNPGSVAEARSFHERTSKDRTDVRYAGRINDQIVFYGSVMLNKNAGDGTYWFTLSFDPNSERAQDIFTRGVQEAERRIKAFDGKRSMFESRGEYAWEKDILEKLGFTLDMKLPFSCLEVKEAISDYHPSVISFGEFLRQNPDDGLQKIWRLEMDIAADLPLPFPFVETPFDTYSNFLNDPEVDLECKFVFLEDGQLKGMTQLWPSKVNPTLASTGLTGVRRDFRRQGVATKAKKHSTAWAKERGIEKIFTDNEENNPMYQLNLQLGFRHLFDYEVYSKPC
jgi:GNAT superfamily N-acetyltransferase